ncbi:GPW/gp25 family protein [Leptolyngbya ohadii]|uniref:GPW/gp25 family protein n=1 Tax=Leptolyngbya ohadii TaxID=1962290 RepID=UPI000B59D6AF|nr:GPW/gp25 family protein [Leptolyngbya ohadii]
MATPGLSPPLIGWPLLPLPDRNGELHFPTLEASIRQTIEVILRTRPGEQLMRPEFGAGLDNFLNEQNTIVIRRQIRDRIVEALEQWERRILLNRVDLFEVPNQPTHLRIEISYRLRRTGTLERIGLTMELEV